MNQFDQLTNLDYTGLNDRELLKQLIQAKNKTWGVPSHTQAVPMAPSHRYVESRPRYNYAPDEETEEGLKELATTGKDFATMLPSVVAKRLAEGAAGTGAAAGSLLSGQGVDTALRSYTEAGDEAKQQAATATRKLFGNESNISKVLGHKLFEPAAEYIANQSSNPDLGRRVAEGAMDLGVLSGAGKRSPLVQSVSKGAATLLVGNYLKNLSNQQLSELAAPLMVATAVPYTGNKLKGQYSDIMAKAPLLEVSDAAASLKQPLSAEVLAKHPTVGSVLNHPALFEQAPWLKDTVIIPEKNPELAGSSYGKNVIALSPNSSLTDALHEIQHSALWRNKYPQGTSFDDPTYSTNWGEERARRTESNLNLPQEQLQRDPYQGSDIDLDTRTMSSGAISNKPKTLAEQRAELQEAIKNASPEERKALGMQLAALKQQPPAPIAKPAELPAINPAGPTFQLKSLNLINQLKPEMKLDGQQLEKYLRERGVSKDEITSVFGDLRGRGINPAKRWSSLAEQGAPKIDRDIYSRDTQGAPYKEYFPEADPGTYSISRVKTELPGQPQSLDSIAQEMFGKTHAQLGVDAKKIVFDEYLHRSESGRYVSSNWKESEHAELSDTKNPLGGNITDIQTLPSGERVLRLFESQTPNVVKDAAKSQETYAKKQWKNLKYDKYYDSWEATPEPIREELMSEAKVLKNAMPVPEPLATRAQEIYLKDLVADAQKQGLAGIILPTGEQIIDRWSSALKNIADEARYNSETQELQLYKNGRRVMQNDIPKKVPKDEVHKYIGEDSADRLFEQNVNEPRFKIKQLDSGNWSVIDTRDNYQLFTGDKQSVTDQARIFNADSTMDNPSGFQTVKDLSISKRWPVIEYGEWGKDANYKPGKVAKILERLTGGKVELLPEEPLRCLHSYLDTA